MTRIVIVGNYLDHGLALQEITTGLSIMFSKRNEIAEVIIYTVNKDQTSLNSQNRIRINGNNKIRVVPLIDVKSPFSMLRILKAIRVDRPDIVLFNMLPTTFGREMLSNFIFHIVPMLISRRKHKVKVIYHNSPITNEYVKLGYDDRSNKFKVAILIITEFALFHLVDTFMPLKSYVLRIQSIWHRSKVKHINLKYIAALPSYYYGSGKASFVTNRTKSANTLKILLFGYWGPQKDLERSLRILGELKLSGYSLSVTIAGPVNRNAKNFIPKFEKLLLEYEYLLNEKMIRMIYDHEIKDLFTKHDVLLLTYKVSGGYSDVLSIGMFYGISVVVNDLPEFREEVIDYKRVMICQTDNEIKDAIVHLTVNRERYEKVETGGEAWPEISSNIAELSSIT